MSFDGGFGAVVWVRGDLIRDLIKAAHFHYGDRFKRAVEQTFDVAGTAVVVRGIISLDSPALTLRKADRAARLGLSAWGRLTASAQDGPEESCTVRLTAEVLVPFSFDQPFAPDLSYVNRVYLDLSQFSVVSATVEVPFVSPSPGTHVPALAVDPGFRDFLVESLRKLGGKSLRVDVPVSMVDAMERAANADLVSLPTIRPAAIEVQDDSIAICGNLFDSQNLNQPISEGPADQLEQPWDAWAGRCTEQRTRAGLSYAMRPGDAQVIAVLRPPAVEKFGSLDLRLKLRVGLANFADLRLDDAEIRLGQGQVDLDMTLTKIMDDPFPDIHGRAIVSAIPMHDYVFLAGTDVHAATDGLLGIVDLATGVVQSILRDKLVAGLGEPIRRVNWLLPQARYFGDLPLAGGTPGNAKLSVSLEGAAVDPGWLMVGVEVKLPKDQSADPLLDDPSALPHITASVARDANGQLPHYAAERSPDLRGRRQKDGLWRMAQGAAAHIRDRRVILQVADHPALRQVATLRLRWTVTGGPPEAPELELVPNDNWIDAPGALTLELDLWELRLHPIDRYNVRADWYQPPYDPTRTVNTDSFEFWVIDRFDRHLPYARWNRLILLQLPGAGPGGSIGGVEITRMSAIHKTNIHQRCLFSDAGLEPRFGLVEPLAALPAPEETDLRAALCAYCFGKG